MPPKREVGKLDILVDKWVEKIAKSANASPDFLLNQMVPISGFTRAMSAVKKDVMKSGVSEEVFNDYLKKFEKIEADARAAIHHVFHVYEDDKKSKERKQYVAKDDLSWRTITTEIAVYGQLKAEEEEDKDKKREARKEQIRKRRRMNDGSSVPGDDSSLVSNSTTGDEGREH